MDEPCQTGLMWHHFVLGVLAAGNTALATFLAYRRVVADRERRNGASGGNQRSGTYGEGQWTTGGPTDGPR